MPRARLAAAAAIALAPILVAQQRSPHAGYVYPAGGRRGTTVEVRVGGQYLIGANKAYVSGRGVEARVIRASLPLSGAEVQELRDRMQKLNEKRTASQKPPADGSPKVIFTDEDRKTVAEIRDKLEDVQRRRSIPALAEIAILQIAVAADAPLGRRELRLDTAAGLTNPIAFSVGELPEFSRPPVRVPPAFNVVNGAPAAARAAPRQPEPPTEIALPAVLNGQMMPGASDQYRFRAAKGQHLVVAASARELIPYVADAVPGWFQAVLTLRDAEGKELASADHYLFHPDPLLGYEIPRDGDYVVEIHDSIYRGREDFIYRITIGELPLIASVFPLGGKTGSRTRIETHGWNLPAARVTEDFRGQAKGVYPVTLRQGGWTSNAVPFALDSLREASAKPGIGSREKAQKVKLPGIVNGRIEQPGESQFFRFDGRAGDEIVAEVLACRLGSPLDSVLRLTSAAGKELAVNDDFEDKGAGLITHQADSFISVKLPAKGTYYLELADAERKGGVEYGYRLRIGHPRPDFELRVVPSSLNLRAGSTAPITVYALRRDGFAGEIALALEGAPAGFALSGAAVPSGQDKVRITLTVPRTPVALPLSMQLIGKAAIDGREVRHAAVPAEDMEQAFAYHHLVAEDAWMARIIGGSGGGGFPWRMIDRPVRLPAGGTAAVQVFTPPQFAKGTQMALNDPPDGVSIQGVTPAPGGVSIILRAQPGKTKPGIRGNLIVDVSREAAANSGRRPPGRPQPLGTLPAIPFEVVESAAPQK